MPREPAPTPRPDVTLLLSALARGETKAAEDLLPLLLVELGQLARVQLRSQRAGHTLQPTALVNEAWLKLVGASGSFSDRAHFFATAARAMRQVLVDHERARRTDKRGGDAQRLTLQADLASGTGAPEVHEVDILDLDVALEELSALDERQARVVDLRYFAGLEMEEVAEALGVSKTTVERDWRAARAWLWRRLKSA